MDHMTLAIGGVTVKLTSPCPIPLKNMLAPFVFRTDSPKICIEMTAVDALAEPTGRFLGAQGGQRFWEDGLAIICRTRAPSRHYSHMEIRYPLGRGPHIEARIRRADWDWVMDPARLWAGLSLNHPLIYHGVVMMRAVLAEHQGEGVLFASERQDMALEKAELWCRQRGGAILSRQTAIRFAKRPIGYTLPDGGSHPAAKSLPVKLALMVTQEESLIRKPGFPEASAMLSGTVYGCGLVRSEEELIVHRLYDLVQSCPVYVLPAAAGPEELSRLDSLL